MEVDKMKLKFSAKEKDIMKSRGYTEEEIEDIRVSCELAAIRIYESYINKGSTPKIWSVRNLDWR